ncbi:MAG: 30S ribosomal protein S5 [Candidatus Micrarchaeota archaeon]
MGRDRDREERNWIPRTEIGRKVAAKEITNIDEILASGKRILETEIVDALLPDLKDEVLQIKSTQRMTAYGRKQQMRAVVILGNQRGYIAVGVGKAAEVRDAIAEAIVEAKKNIIRVRLGCGSWECGCGSAHSLRQKVSGKSSSTQVTIEPAPRGIGLVAGENTKKVLELAGVSDCWTFSRGRTRNILNAVLATLKALNSANMLKQGKYFVEEIAKIEVEIKEEPKSGEEIALKEGGEANAQGAAKIEGAENIEKPSSEPATP